MAAATDTAVTRDLASARDRVTTPDEGGLDFARLLGAGWLRLAPDIRDRFSEKPKPGRPIRYRGTMEVVDSSAAGWMLAQFCRLIGTPFAPWRGCDVPVAITLRAVPGEDAIIWEREYRYRGRKPMLVRSIKRCGRDTGLREYVGGGFGMSLDICEEDGALHFRSRRYFWRRGGRLLWLPRPLTPGATHVVHQDLGDGSFRFAMTVRHRLFGTLFHQDGIFRREEIAP